MSGEASYRARSVKGMRDLLPPETAVWNAVEATAREVFGRYGFEEIRTPVVEETELFVRGVGGATDIVGKEMYTFADKKGKSLTLRPENTAPVARAYAQHQLASRPQPLRLYYIGPQFRYERPQKGRYRQFYQIGAEILGDEGPWTDAEVVVMLVRFLEALGFEDLDVLINTVGDRESRERYRERLVGFLSPLADELGEDSRRRLDTNPLRILDTKSPREIELLADAPRLRDSLNDASRAHFDEFCSALGACDVSFRLDDRLVRGLDYYTRTVFEIQSGRLGAQSALVGGGRYDGLVEEVGGPPTPGIGFAIGLDRLVECLPERSELTVTTRPSFAVVRLGEVSMLDAIGLSEELRLDGLEVIAELSGSLRSALRRADRRGSAYAILFGDDELAAGKLTVKRFEDGYQIEVRREGAAQALRDALGLENPS
ncbi:MAG: histidine--tRNA ligase [Acidobacteriota bacterium]|nr:histidine--tRNA ligase [Acidobacteriota bacterium]